MILKDKRNSEILQVYQYLEEENIENFENFIKRFGFKVELIQKDFHNIIITKDNKEYYVFDKEYFCYSKDKMFKRYKDFFDKEKYESIPTYSVFELIEESGKLNKIKYNDNLLINLSYNDALFFISLLKNDFEDSIFVMINEESGKIV